MRKIERKIIVVLLLLTSIATVSSFAQELTLAEALDCPGVIWAYGGNMPWIPIRSPSHDGVDAARSGMISDDESSAIGTYFIGPGTLSFWWKVSSEMNADCLWFFVNGNTIDVITGNRDWTYKEVRLPAGTNIVVWEYIKDDTVSEGLDAGFLDEVKFIPDYVQPKLEISRLGSSVLLSWQLQPAPFYLEETDDLSDNWQKSTIPVITNQNTAIAVVTNLTSKKFFRLKLMEQ